MAGQRQYEFAVEVIAGPPNSVFRHTKVVTVKSKFMVENQTGMPIEIKQAGTPDLDCDKVAEETRCARRLEISERWDLHVLAPGLPCMSSKGSSKWALQPACTAASTPLWISRQPHDLRRVSCVCMYPILTACLQGSNSLGRCRPQARAADAPCGVWARRHVALEWSLQAG